MESATCSFAVYFVAILLVQMPVPISAQFMVHGTVEPLVVTLGGQVEIHCHISPPQSATHMEVRWFRDHYTKPVYLYQDGKDLHAEIIKEYVERTKFLKEAIGEGNVTLRIQNIVASDVGKYHCLFKDGDFFDEAIVELQVAAIGLEIQLNVNVTETENIKVECNSGGWFPKPQIQWIDSSGQIIPPSSNSHSQDGSQLFHMSTAVILKDNSKGSIICYLKNPVTGQEKWTSIELADAMFPENFVLEIIVFIVISVLLFVRCGYFSCYQPRNSGFRNIRTSFHMQIILMFLFCLIMLCVYIAYLFWQIKDPALSANIITNKEKIIIHVVVTLFVFMFTSLLCVFLRGMGSRNQDDEG